MACSRLVFSVLLLSVSCYATRVPVFLWGDLAKTSLKSNPLTTIETPEFSSILKEELAEAPFTVIFSEQNLSVEDFSRKNGDGETTFPYLHANLGNSVYLPSVHSPLTTLNKIADPEKADHVKLTENGISTETEYSAGRFLFINLEDAKEGETREDLLRRHNDFMEDMITKLQKQNVKFIAVYTAHYPSWVIPTTHSRVRRQASSNETGDFVLDGLRLYAKHIRLQDGDNIINLSGRPNARTEFNDTSSTMSTTLTFSDNSIVLNFKQAGGYWSFNSVTLSPTTPDALEVYPTTEVYALMDFSYRCGPNVSFVTTNGNRSLHFENMKIQPFFKTTNESIRFGDSFNCVGFFSAPIWASLFVVFVLLSITFFGIMMMMDIKTMDRFDDPKGKTITINAAE